MKRPLLAALLLLPALPAAAGPREDILAADRAFSDMSVAKGSDYAFWRFIASDGKLFGLGGPATAGKDAAAKRVPAHPGPDKDILRWTADAAGVSADGTLGWSDGHWHFGGGAGQQTGHYLTVWKKEGADWKVAADMGTVDPPSNSRPKH